MMGKIWNPWHGCQKYSEGCQYCYVYRSDERHGRDASLVTQTQDFTKPIKTKRNGEYVIPSGTTIYTCFTSDFLIEAADQWRMIAWQIMKQRSDCTFLFLTKRIERLAQLLPADWGDGYPNVVIGCTCENQRTADYRLPIFLQLPIKHRIIIHEPLLSSINIEPYLEGIEAVIVGGESGTQARVCDYQWVLQLKEQCVSHQVNFTFKQTGQNFQKDGILYKIPRIHQHQQAKRAAIDLHYFPVNWE